MRTLAERIKGYAKYLKNYIFSFIVWMFLSLTVGVTGGIVGTLFSKSVSLVTHIRGELNWLILLLPLGGLLSVGLYKLCRVDGVGTNQIISAVRGKAKVSPLLTPAIFLASVITHLLGGSAGREGAALQLGGSVSSLLSKLLHLDEKTTRVLTMCGMSAVFSALFGTPLGACVFALEVIGTGTLFTAAIFPCIISSFAAFATATLLGVKAERFHIVNMPSVQFDTLWKVILIAALGALVSFIFVKSLHFSEKFMHKYLKNEFLRIFLGGSLIVLLTVLLRTTDYNGGGMDIIEHIFTKGEFHYEAFALKILFTVITVSAGYKGGEIVPSLFIGATFGAATASLLGLDVAFGAAIGMAALLCGVTNCTLATIIICTELFSAEGMIYFAIASVLSRLLSGNTGLYINNKLPLIHAGFDNSSKELSK